MKILAIGDLHCRPQYLKDFLQAKEEILRVVQEEKPDFVVLMGDSLHNHSQVHTDAHNAVFDLVSRLSDLKDVHTVMLVGNHDYRSNSEFCTNNHPFNSFKKYVTVVDSPILIERLCFIPYTPPGRFNEAVSMVDLTNVELIFAHQEFKGAMFGITSVHGDTWEQKIPVISGHIHDKQMVNNIMYIGTPYMTTFGESEDKTISLFAFVTRGDKTSIKRKEITLDVPKRLTLYKNTEDVIGFVPDGKNYFRLIVRDELSKILSFKKSDDYKKLQGQGIKIVTEPIESEKITSTSKETYLDILKFMTQNDDKLSALLQEVIND